MGKKMLYEFTALVSCAAVIAAESREEALEHLKTWERAWVDSGSIIGVSDIEFSEMREPSDQEFSTLCDESDSVA